MSLQKFKEAVVEMIGDIDKKTKEEWFQTFNEEAQKISEKVDSVFEKAMIQESRITGNITHDDLIGTKLYNVHFVEYQNGVKIVDVPVFLASFPEWAFGYCKSHLEMAIKDETKQDKDWWYFYVTEMEVNTADVGETWIAAINWEGRLANNTYHYDKGYNFDYHREHIIFAQDENEECEDCVEHEKEEEVKIAERTVAALDSAQEFMKKFFNAESTIIRKDGDFYKIWAVVKSDKLKITDYEYKTLHKEFGVSAGNRILFYLVG